MKLPPASRPEPAPSPEPPRPKASSLLSREVPWLTKRRRRLLWNVFFGSVLLHVVLLIVGGSLVVYRHYFQREVQFKAPPPAKRIDPRKLEYKVRVEEQQKKSGRPLIQPRLSAQRVSDISLPEVKVDIEPVRQKLAASTLKSFGGTGIGSGLGGGQGQGGLGLGVSQVNFFGITDRGERIAFLVDCSKSMLEDQRGGMAGYEAVKTELTKMVNKLSEGTFFNVYMFGDDVDVFQPKLMLASPRIKEELVKWIKPYNADWKQGKLGNLYRNWRPFLNHPGDYYAGGIPAAGGSTRLDLALAAAFEQGADTIFILTDGVPVIAKLLTGKEREEYDKVVEDWKKRNKSRELTQIEKKMQERAREEYEEKKRKETERRAKKGIAPKIVEQGGGYGGPGPPTMGSWSQAEVLDHLKQLEKLYYKDKGKKPPKIHCVAYQTDPGAEQFLKELAYGHRGRFRQIKALVKPITGS